VLERPFGLAPAIIRYVQRYGWKFNLPQPVVSIIRAAPQSILQFQSFAIGARQRSTAIIIMDGVSAVMAPNKNT
jgi:hypothetical protein